MADNRPGVYVEEIDGRPVTVYRTSGAGQCMRALVALGKNYQGMRDQASLDLLNRTAEEGNLHERDVVDRLLKAGIAVTEQQKLVEVWVVPGRVLLRGHMEGLIAVPDHPEIVFGMREPLSPGMKGFEVKSMSKGQFSKWLSDRWNAFPKYAFQVSTYMMEYPEYDWEYFVKRRDDGTLHHHTIKAGQPPIPFNEVLARIKKAEVARRNKKTHELPPCDMDNWFCDFKYLHEEGPIVDESNLSDEELEMLGELVGEYKELKQLEEIGEEAGKTRKRDIVPRIMGLAGKNDKIRGIPYQGKLWKVSITRQTRNQPDLEAIRAFIGDEKWEEFVKPNHISFPVIKEDDGK